MRGLVLLFAAAGLLLAQPSPFIVGHLTVVSRDKIEVRDGPIKHVLYSDAASKIWRGRDYPDFSALQIGDEVWIRYRRDHASRSVVTELFANMGKVEGRITHVDANGFQVDENYDADPRSGYRRGLRQIVYDSGTRWESSLPEDLKAGRDVFVMGLKLPGDVLEATSVTVYEGRRPVRMKPGTRIISPDGTIH